MAAAFLLLVVPDYRPLLGIAYAPIVLLGAPFHWPPEVGIADVLPWAVVNQLICMAGGVAWAAAAIVHRRRRLGACVRCGRSDEPPRAGDSRWGRWAPYVAVIVPLLYAAMRFAWALGIPLGITEESLREGQETGLRRSGRRLRLRRGRGIGGAGAGDAVAGLGVALAVASLDHHRRRRGRCPRCGRE
ncbi:MAG TPA: hypothetical protein VF058_04400 [Actinomycetota bacterium]